MNVPRKGSQILHESFNNRVTIVDMFQEFLYVFIHVLERYVFKFVSISRSIININLFQIR